MRVTWQSLIDTLEPENHWAGLLAAKGWTAAQSAPLARLFRAVSAEIATFREIRSRLVRKHSGAAEGAEAAINPSSSSWPAFWSEYSELIAQEVELPGEPVRIPATAEVTPAALVVLDPFVTVED